MRRVFQVLYSDGRFEPVILEVGESVIWTQQASTLLSKLLDGGEDPLPEELKAEMLAIEEAYLRGDFVDITDKIDDEDLD